MKSVPLMTSIRKRENSEKFELKEEFMELVVDFNMERRTSQRGMP